MKKLTEKKLRAFCDRSKLITKRHNTHLIGRGDWTIAHNGHVMVLAPSRAGIAPDPCAGCTAPGLDAFERILGEDWRGAWLPVNPMAKADQRVIVRRVMHIETAAAKRARLRNGGAERFTDYFDVQIGVAHIQWAYWNLISTLPGAEIAVTDQDDNRIRFRAAHGIIGAVMPLRQ